MLIPSAAFPQEIAGFVKDSRSTPLSMASVMLQRTRDTAVVKRAMTNARGRYRFSPVEPGNYFVTVSHTGFHTKRSIAFELMAGATVNVPDIIPERAVSNLRDITIVSKKPLVEVQADKTILNVAGTINATGTDALELLRKSPGVTVDRNDNLGLAGKNGLLVYIDGHPSPLNGKDLADYLRSLSPVMIESIELITNPSAKYDAAGNAGIINIRLKKNKSGGANGSLNGGYNIGVYSKYNGGASLNHRSGKLNLFGQYNYTYGLNESFMHLHREVQDTLFDQRSVMLNKGHSHNFKAGADYFIDKRHTIGMIISGNAAANRISSDSRTPIAYIPTGTVNRILIANNRSTAQRQNLSLNLNYRYADSAGYELNIDADHGSYHLRNDQLQPNYYYDPKDETELYHVINNMVSPTDIKINSLKADYEQPFKKGSLGIGGKASFVNTRNNFERYDVNGDEKTLDTARSNFFEYREQIQAMYINYKRQIKGWMIQAGLRMEHTRSEGRSNQFFRRSYTNFFPSAALTYSKNPESQFNLTFSRRIDRPAYQDLNPFEFKLDEYTFLKGNTELRPQYTNSFGLSHTFRYKLNTSINYSSVTDILAQLVDTTERSKSFLTKKNLASQRLLSFNISYPFSYKWYMAFGNLNAYYSRYKADFGPGRMIDLDVYVVNVYMQHSFDMGKGWKSEISGWYVSPSIWQGFSKSGKMWSVDAGVQKTILKGAANIKAAVSDIFQSMRWKGATDFAGQHSFATGGWESRLFKLSFSWRFGDAQLKALRQRKTGAEEENKRVKESNDGMNRQ